VTTVESIDLNADAGESYGAWTLGDDRALFAHVSSTSIACGFHAGDPTTMRTSVEAALEAGVAVGAHPGLPDIRGFGRRTMALTPQDVHDDTLYQVAALAAFVTAAGERLHHVKPHGALNTAVAESSDAHAEAVVYAVRALDSGLPVIAIAGSRLHRVCERLGHPVVAEAFPDRAYAPGGGLLPRRQEGSSIEDPELAARRAVRMVLEQSVVAADGSTLALSAATLCIHGDGPRSVEIAYAVRASLEQAGITIAAF
jgi:5-oxoprolinase (ATP-hydrolysing) subunit A